MSDRYRLVALRNEQLVSALRGLVERENDALSDLLAHLAELDRRRLYLDLGFPSLFAYCTEALGFCKSSAGRRIAAARVCQKYPAAFVRVAKGELRLSVLAVLGPYLQPEHGLELLDACSHKSFEQVELLLAARFPKPDVCDSIRRLPQRSEVAAPDIGSESMARAVAVLGELMRATAPEAPQERANTSDAPRDCATAPPTATATAMRTRIEPLSVDRFGIHFTADREFRELLEEVRALASRMQPGGELLPLMKHAFEAYRRELQKKRFGAGRRVRSASQAAASPSRPGNSRHIPAAVARAVYLRDGGCCTFCAEDGRRCAARRFLELDHIVPWAEGGGSTIENLRLRCRAHNLHAARIHFGSERISQAVAAARFATRARSAVR